MWGSREAVETGGIDELVSLYVRINNAISGNEAEGIAPDPVLAENHLWPDGGPIDLF